MHSFHVCRHDPDADQSPRVRELALAVRGADRMLPDVPTRPKTTDPRLGWRRSCREGVGGSDTMSIHGKSGLPTTPPEGPRPRRLGLPRGRVRGCQRVRT
jgi:succinate dehydrogenase / fumarate reductase iron-sulfur subunit